MIYNTVYRYIYIWRKKKHHIEFNENEIAQEEQNVKKKQSNENNVK